MNRAYFVDDEPLILEEMISNPLFNECGYQVIGFSSKSQIAVKEIKKLNPDVVFTDLMMPELSGVEMISQLREIGAECEFVIISAYPEFNEQRRFFLLDGFDYLLKPVSNHDLQQLLNNLAARLATKKYSIDDRPVSLSPELNKIVTFLKQNVMDKHTLESLTEMFHMNTSYICQLFSKYLGTTFVAYLTKLRMEEAAKLLKGTRLDVKEIAELCGYNDYFYFCRVFRRHLFCTPTAFRENTITR